jgi:hypothetical protein
MGQAAPLAARPSHVEDHIEEVMPCVLPWTSRFARRRQQGYEDMPYIVRQISRIRDVLHACTVQALPPAFSPFQTVF